MNFAGSWRRLYLRMLDQGIVREEPYCRRGWPSTRGSWCELGAHQHGAGTARDERAKSACLWRPVVLFWKRLVE